MDDPRKTRLAQGFHENGVKIMWVYTTITKDRPYKTGPYTDKPSSQESYEPQKGERQLKSRSKH